ncbi:HNH endonuclease [Methylobacterium sp. Leaf113]|uniref:HNH endonuclease n=1 Tax=Methylobacterium sp. Leaf113 TaxID=1736259 RepID=UPI000A6B7285|nr:HNH endonuclease [Methylobacterium sp. Leaf113]
MLEILWLKTDSKGYIDRIPLYWLVDEGVVQSDEHEIIGPRKGIYTVRCGISVKENILILYYGGQNKIHNLRLDNIEIGQMKIVFSNESRRSIRTIYWKSDDQEEYEQAPVSASIIENPEDGDTSLGSEGEKRLVVHIRRERKPGLRNKKIRQVLDRGENLRCEACEFDFEAHYGVIGRSACEVHHRVQLASTDGPREVFLSDLAILCANCHRVIHRTSPMIDVSELKTRMLDTNGIHRI